MRMRAMVGAVLVLTASSAARAQDGPAGAWQKSAHLTIGATIRAMDWDSTHGYVVGSGRVEETVFGAGNRPLEVGGGFEVRKNHIAIQGNVGTASVCVSILGPEQSLGGIPYNPGRCWHFRAYQVEGAFLYFPLARGKGRLEPYLSAGLGFLTTSGDASMRGGSISYGGGVRITVRGRLAIDGGIKGQYQRYNDFPLVPPVMMPTLTFTPVAATVGARITL